MPASELRLNDLAQETGFSPSTLEKVLRLGELLADIGRHPLLSEVLLLNGGTPINLCYGEPRRLSVDLDFNYVGAAEREAMLEQRPLVERAVETIVAAGNYRVQRSAPGHAGEKLFLGYTNAGGTADRVEVDLNYLHRVPIAAPEFRDLWQPGDADRPCVHLVGEAELWIGKLCALLDRGAPRDLYDIGSMPASVDQDPSFKRLFVALAGSLDRPLHHYGRERLERITPEAIEQQLHPMLTQGDRPAREDLIAAGWARIRGLLSLADSEREYSDRLQQGELLPEILFPEDEETATKIALNPPLLWKVENARRR